jgi:hypothetical protein
MRFVNLLVLVLVPVFTWAAPPEATDQATIDEILGPAPLDFPHAAWLVGRAAGTFDESVDVATASARAQALGWGSADSALTLAGYSQVLVKGLGLPTGLVYGWFPGPRYAYRELVFRRIVPGSLDSDSPVSGETALRYLQATQDWKEAHR